MNRNMNSQPASQVSRRCNVTQHASYIQQAAAIHEQSEPDWHTRDEAYQHNFLRNMRLEMVDSVRNGAPQFGVDQTRKNFELLVHVARPNVKHTYKVLSPNEPGRTGVELQSFSDNNFQRWNEFGSSNRTRALYVWHKVLDGLALEDSDRFDRLLGYLRLFAHKSKIFDQEEMDAEREAVWIETIADHNSGLTVFELAKVYYEIGTMWLNKPNGYRSLFLQRLQHVPTHGADEKDLSFSLYRVLALRAHYAKFDLEGRNDQNLYWPEASYEQPGCSREINNNIQYCRSIHPFWRVKLMWTTVNVYSPWNRNEAVRRFNNASHTLSQEQFPYSHLPFEVSLLIPLPRIVWPRLPEKKTPKEKERKGRECGEKQRTEERSEDGPNEEESGEEEEENEEQSTSKAHVPSKGDIPFLPDPYPFKIADIKNHRRWTELMEFLSYVYGVDEGELAERVVSMEAWNTVRNLIRKRIAHKRMVHRVLDEDTTVTRKNGVTKIAYQIVNGGMVGKGHFSGLTDEQLLFVSSSLPHCIHRYADQDHRT